MLRIALVLAACAFANPDSILDTVRTESWGERAYHPGQQRLSLKQEMNAPALTNPTPAKSQSDYLRLAGYHWLWSVGLGAGATAVGFLSDWDDSSARILVWGLYGASLGFYVAAPIDLIFAGKERTKP